MSHTSDHFDLIADFARQLIREGNAYMDDTPVEQMRKERGDMVESKRRCVSPTVPRPCAAWRRGRFFVILLVYLFWHDTHVRKHRIWAAQ